MSKDIDQNGNISQISQPIEDLFDFKIGENIYSYYIMNIIHYLIFVWENEKKDSNFCHLRFFC